MLNLLHKTNVYTVHIHPASDARLSKKWQVY